MSLAEEAQKRGYLYEDFRFFHNRDSRGVDMEAHYHEFHKLILILKGSGSYTISGQRYELLPGDILLVGSHVPHRPEIPAGSVYERLTFFLSEEFLRDSSLPGGDLEALFSAQRSGVLRPSAHEGDTLRRLAFRVEQELQSEAFGSALRARLLTLTLLVELGRLEESGEHQLSPVSRPDNKIPQLLRYIDEHLTEELSIEEIAGQLHFSPYHLMHLFKAELGTGVHRYINERRLLLARQLIARGESATTACYACGYRSYSSFARAYRAFFGASPKQKAPQETPYGAGEV